MRVRPLAVLGAVFGAAALAAAIVVTQLPREGERSAPPGPAAAPAARPAESALLAPLPSPSDGVVAVRVTAGGAPQADAVVRAYVADAAGAWWRAGEARAGADGIARLPARPGALLLVASTPGLAPGRIEVVRPAGAEVTYADVALEAFAALEGCVADRGGVPVAGARIRAIPLVSRWPGLATPSAPPEEVASTTADRAGAFRLDALSPGAYALEVVAPGFHPLLVQRAAVPSELLALEVEPLGHAEGTVLLADGRRAAGAVVRAASADHGATATADAGGRFVLEAPAGSYLVLGAQGAHAGAAPAPVAIAAGATTRGVEVRLGDAAALSGTVVHAATGAPAAGAEIAVLPHGTREVAARAAADAAGRFELAALAPGAFDVRASAPGASPALVTGVALVPGGRFFLELALQGTGAVSGTVRDLAGRPLAGVSVRVVQRGDGLAGAAPLEARTGFDGGYRIEGIEAGRAELVALQEGVALGESRSVRIRPGRASAADFFLPEAGLLVGRVSAAGGPPPAGTAVVAVAMKAGLGTLQVARAAADATGNYRLSLPAGEYRVHAAPAAAPRTDLRVAPAFARVDPERTARLDLQVAAAAAEPGVEILVLEPGGAPSPGAVVTLARPEDEKVAFATSAGEDGRVVLGRGMGFAGRVLVRARNGGRTGAAVVELPPSGTVPVRLAPGGAVQGVVRAPGGAVSGFTLEIASQPAPAGWRTVEVRRFAGDRFELGDLPSEPLRLVVRAADGRGGAADVRVAAGEVRAVEIAVR